MKTKKIAYKDIEICYTDRGKSDKILVFLHGYLENKSIWDGFVVDSFNDYRVLQIDLLGHGETGFTKEATIEEMSKAVHAVLESEAISKIVLLGHSMGGYVTLAFAEQFPEYLESFVLVHSTAFADDEQKKLNRQKAIKMVKEGRKALIIRTAVPNTFAIENQTKLKKEIEFIVEQAMKTSEEGIEFALEAMKNRKDRIHVLNQNKIPYLLIIGEKDTNISFESSVKLLYLSHKSKHGILKSSGHMGFIEQAQESRELILNFLES